MDFAIEVQSDGTIEVTVTAPEAPEVVEVAAYTDANVRTLLLGLLTDNTVLARISGALSTVGLIPADEAAAGTATTLRLVSAARLKSAIDALAVARVVALVGDEQLVTRAGATLAGTTVASIVAAAVAAVVDGAVDGTLLTRSGADVTGTSIASIIAASVTASVAEVLGAVGDGELLTRSGAGVDGTSIAAIVSTAIAGALAAVDAVGQGYLVAADGGGLTAVQGIPWADLTGVPATFPPSSHTHAWGDVTGADAAARTAVAGAAADLELVQRLNSSTLQGIALSAVYAGARDALEALGPGLLVTSGGVLAPEADPSAAPRRGRLAISGAGALSWDLSPGVDATPRGTATYAFSGTTGAPSAVGSLAVTRTSVTNASTGTRCYPTGGYFQRNTASSAAAPNRAYWSATLAVGGNYCVHAHGSMMWEFATLTADQQIGIGFMWNNWGWLTTTSTAAGGGSDMAVGLRVRGTGNFEFVARDTSTCTITDCLIAPINGAIYLPRVWFDAAGSYWQIWRLTSRTWSLLGNGASGPTPTTDSTSGYGQAFVSVGQSTAIGTAGSIQHNCFSVAGLGPGGA